MRLILGGSRAGYVDAALARTRMHAGSLSASPDAVVRPDGRARKALGRDDLVEAERAVARSHLARFDRRSGSPSSAMRLRGASGSPTRRRPAGPVAGLQCSDAAEGNRGRPVTTNRSPFPAAEAGIIGRHGCPRHPEYGLDGLQRTPHGGLKRDRLTGSRGGAGCPRRAVARGTGSRQSNTGKCWRCKRLFAHEDAVNAPSAR